MFGKLISGLKKAVGRSEVKKILAAALTRMGQNPLVPKDASETFYSGVCTGMFCILDELLQREVVDQESYDECSDMLEMMYASMVGKPKAAQGQQGQAAGDSQKTTGDISATAAS